MARRSDHSRTELRTLILMEAHRHMAEVGFARFSAREVAKRIGYAVGTIYNVYGSLDRLFLAVNTRTFVLWAREVRNVLAEDREDRVAALVDAYFSFARDNRNLWSAIYDHRLPTGMDFDDEDREARAFLTGEVARVVTTELAPSRQKDATEITSSLVATVHGHCDLEMTGSLAVLTDANPRRLALDRVRETLSFGRV